MNRQIERAEWLRQNIRTNPYRSQGDPLMDRYHELAFTNDIQDMQAYAMDWQRLGNEAAKQNRPALAENCYSHAKHYSEIDGGHYYRIVDGCLAELQRGDMPQGV